MKPLNKQILKLAVPNIISNLTVPLLSSADTALVGHLPEPYFIGAVALGSMIFNFIYWGFGFLRMGTTGFTAQAYGAGDHREMVSFLGRALLVSLAGSLLVIALQKPIAEFSFYLIHGSDLSEHYARRYFYIRILAAPATLGLYAFQGWFLGMQNAKYPLYLTVVTNLLNLGFNVLFVLGLNMNSDGVAWGTVCAQYLGLILALFLFRKKYGAYLFHFDLKAVLEMAALKCFFSINSDIFLRTLALVFAFSFFTAKSAEFGDNVLAANSILLQLWMIFSYGIDGFAYAAESLVGKSVGAGDVSGLKRVIRAIFLWGMGLGAAFSLLYFAIPGVLARLFTGQEAVILLVQRYFLWTQVAPVLNSVCYIWDGVYIGATASRAMRNTSFVATFLIFLPVYYVSRNLWGNHGMWLAMTLFMAARGFSLHALRVKYIYRLKPSDGPAY